MKRGAFKQALFDACSQVGTYLEQSWKAERIRAEQRQQYRAKQLQQQQQLAYQQPFTIRLDSQQLQMLDSQLRNFPYASTADLLLRQQQIGYIVQRFIQAAAASGDRRTMQQFREILLPSGLEFNLGYLRQIHEELYQSFIYIYNPGTTYPACMPQGTFFLVSDHGFGFLYRIKADKQLTLERLRQEFRGFTNMQAGQQFFRRYGLGPARITYETKTGYLVVFFQ